MFRIFRKAKTSDTRVRSTGTRTFSSLHSELGSWDNGTPRTWLILGALSPCGLVAPVQDRPAADHTLVDTLVLSILPLCCQSCGSPVTGRCFLGASQPWHDVAVAVTTQAGRSSARGRSIWKQPVQLSSDETQKPLVIECFFTCRPSRRRLWPSFVGSTSPFLTLGCVEPQDLIDHLADSSWRQ